MTPFVLTLKNYRCFTDEHPLRLEITEGPIALIGPNNSGKSSALRMIYELRHLWQHLDHQLSAWLANENVSFGAGSVADSDDIFTNLNGRDMEVSLEFPQPPDDHAPHLSKIVVTCPRRTWGNGHAVFSLCNGNTETKLPRAGGWSNTNRGISHPSFGEVDTRDFREAINALLDSIYIGAFRNAINQGAGAYYDIQVGTGFVNLWNAWKVGGTKANMDRTLSVTNAIRDLFDFDSLEINAHASDRDLVVVVNGRSYLLNELGSGLSQFIIVMGNVAIRSPSLILIDEPELNLHPSLQQKFLTKLAAYASKGTVFATHSLGLARSTASAIYSLTASKSGSLVHPFESTPGFGELIGEMSFASFRELGYEHVLLVEGVTDAPVFREFLRKLGADHTVLVIPLGGNQLARGDVEHELSELKRLATGIFAIVDSERLSENDPADSHRVAFEAACDAVSIPVLLTKRRATENYLTDRAVKAAFGQSQRALEPYESRKDAKPNWKKDQNWIAAAQMSRDELLATDLGQFLAEVVVKT